MTNEIIVKGPEIEIDLPITLGQFTKLMLEVHGDKVLQVDADTREEYTASYILNSAIKIARWFERQGLKPGDVISIMSENRLEFCLVPMATYLAGLTLAPLNPEYTTDELQHTLKLSRPKIIFCAPNSLNKIISILGTNAFINQLIVFGQSPPKQHSSIISLNSILEDRFLITLESEEYVSPDVDIDKTVATILCSSGTTGMPKGVMATQKNILTFLSIFREIVNDEIRDNMDDTTIGLVPFFHSMGFMVMTMALLGGKRTVVIKKFKLRQFLQIVQDYKVTILAVPPPVIIMLCQSPVVDQYDLSSLREIRSGAAPLSPEYEKKIKEKFKLKECGQGYGMTETTLGVLYVPPNFLKPSSVGKIVPTMWAKVINENGKSLGPNCEGELCFKGPLIMKGYVNDPVSTADTIDKDGWLHTGDVGYYDNEGFFYIVDRIKELIKYKAFQVPPAELEAILMSHPDILDAAVVGLPDDKAGELPLGYVVIKPFSKITSAQIQDFVKGKVSPQKQLRGGVRFIESIPRNASGKILRRVLKKMATETKSKL